MISEYPYNKFVNFSRYYSMCSFKIRCSEILQIYFFYSSIFKDITYKWHERQLHSRIWTYLKMLNN